ncbi:MAG: EamA family transporter RarD [Desulfobacter sp.]|nr:MAG: EamA family transporter RarD [Desulfobacter sp.]
MNQKLNGTLFGLAAFVAWGLLPVYWKQLQAVNAFEILCHRIIWSCIFLVGIIAWQRRWHEVLDIIHNPKALGRLVISSGIIGLNWFLYIWAVNSGRVVETSLGYYINPMINVLLGFTLLGERFSRIQWIAVGFATAGVVYSLAAYGSLPVFALALAVSFALYGFSRKKIDAAPIPGLFIETLVLFIPALAYVGFRVGLGTSPFLEDTSLSLWCLGSGVVTSLPLLWFAAAAKRLNLSTIGILQYLAPSIAFVLGVFVYKEPFTRHTLVTFAFIWAGVLLYIWESGVHSRHRQ